MGRSAELAGKRLQLLTEIVSKFARLVVLSNPTNPSHARAVQQMRAAAQSFGVWLSVVEASTPDKLDSAFAMVAAVRADCLVVLPDPVFFSQHGRIIVLTAASHLPALFPEKEVVEAGASALLERVAELMASVDEPDYCSTHMRLREALPDLGRLFYRAGIGSSPPPVTSAQ